MNTIRRPRRRPRKRSVSFKSFGWLLIREAYTCISYRDSAPPHSWTRRYVAEERSTAALHRWATSLLRLEPARRWYA